MSQSPKCRNIFLPMSLRSRHIAPLLLLLLLCSCHDLSHEASRLERSIEQQTAKAQQLIARVDYCLEQASLDSLLSLNHFDDNILFYVYNNRRMVYWSSSWLAGSHITLYRYDQWYYHLFDNAHCLCYWTHLDEYNLLIVIPIKYDYAFENTQLRNTYLPPYPLPDNVDISFEKRTDGCEVHAADGSYLFTIFQSEKRGQSSIEQSKLSRTFSFWKLTDVPDENSQGRTELSLSRLQIYVLIAALVCLLVICWGVIGLIKARGFTNMRLRTKMLYVFVALQMFSFVYIFLMSLISVRQRYEQRQKDDLVAKTKYIQKTLQDSYFWTLHLSSRDTEALNVDLRDLSYTFQTDIHVYNMAGDIVGTSAPALFEYGLHSKHIAPEAFFVKNPNLLQYEQIGDLRYLCAYTEFYNGNYVQIGYIAVPLFISSDELDNELNTFLGKLLPPYVVALLLTVLLSVFLARTLTRPLDTLSEKMRQLRIDRHNSYLQYDSEDEIGQLVARYNEMVRELEQSAQKLAASEREGAWRTMARQIAHEINNPLTPMKLTLQQLQRMRGTERFDEYFERSAKMLIDQIDNMSRIASSFSSFAKMPELQTTSVDVAAKLYSVISLFSNNNQDVPIRYVGPQSGVFALTDAEQISLVFNNLIKNALQAVEDVEHGDIIIMLKQNVGTDGQQIEISISDNGRGIPADIQEKVFVPNFTTKTTGTGLGLAISKNIVEGSGGHIRFRTSDKGTIFYVTLLASQTDGE